MLNKDSILAAQDLVSETVAVPEWGGEVRVRGMSGAARDALFACMRDVSGKLDFVGYRAKMLVRCIVDDANQPLFTDADIDALNAKSSLALDRVFQVVERMNGMQPDAVDAAEKN